MAVCIIAVMMMAAVPSFAEVTETVTGGYTVSGNNYDLVKGVFFFPSDQDRQLDIPARFFYSDGFFEEDPYTYNDHLATASICLAMSGFYSNEGDYPTKRRNIVQYMKDIGVAESDIYSNRYSTIKPQTASIGVTIGKKNLSDGRVLIPIAIRGSNYELEWVSNVTLGRTGEAQGFSEAAGKVFGEVKRYIARENLQDKITSGNVVFWVAGYSRAGATANLTAKRLVDEYSAAGNKIFAYGIEPATGGFAGEEKSGLNYGCIHSIVNRSDLVPRVAPYAMGFKRYGTDHYIPGSNPGTVRSDDYGINYDNTSYKTTSAEYQTVKAKMLAQLSAVNPNITFSDTFMILGLGLDETQTGYTLTPGSEQIALEDYFDELITNLQTWTVLTRNVYTGGVEEIPGGYITYGNLQRALRELMVLYGSGSLSVLTSAFQKADTSTLTSLAAPLLNALPQWYNPGFSYKPMYINRITHFLNKNALANLEAPYPVGEKITRATLPIILNLLLTFAAADAGNPLHGTLGLSQLATLVGNIGHVGINHYPEVTFAWLRAQDSLYANETARISATAPAFTPTNANASDGAVIVDIDALSDFFTVHGADPAAVLPSTLTGTGSDGAAHSLNVTWGSPKIYALNETLTGDSWTETSADISAGTRNPLLYVFAGTLSGGTLSLDVATDVTANVYVSGLPRVDPPYSVLPEGEYNGPQSVMLRAANNGEIEYRISRFTSSDTGESLTYSSPVTIGGEVSDSAVEYALVAKVKSTSTTSNDSAEFVWYYKINPAVSEDESSDYVANTTSKIFTLTNDTAVLWSVDVPAGLRVTMTPSGANIIPAERVDVAVVTVAGATKKGTHKIPVQFSTDGTTWTDKESITFSADASDHGGSSGGCNMSLTALGLLLALSELILRRKIK